MKSSRRIFESLAVVIVQETPAAVYEICSGGGKCTRDDRLQLCMRYAQAVVNVQEKPAAV